MALQVDVTYVRTVTTLAGIEQVYALLADPPRSIAHFPDLEALDPQAGGYVWRLKKLGVGKVSLQTVYGCVYTNDPEAKRITWAPMPEVGNAEASGYWALEPAGEGTRITLGSDLRLNLRLSKLLRPVAEPLARKENTRLIDSYVDNLLETFAGGDGRVQ